MDVKEYVSFCEDTLSLGSILYEYPESVGKKIFQIPLRDAYRVAGDSFLRMYHIQYSHIVDNTVYFNSEQEEKFKTLLTAAAANYQSLLNMLDEMWQSYENNPIIRIYLYLS